MVASNVKNNVQKASMIRSQYCKEGQWAIVCGVWIHTETIEAMHASLSASSNNPMQQTISSKVLSPLFFVKLYIENFKCD